jgi:hypothetical protein
MAAVYTERKASEEEAAGVDCEMRGESGRGNGVSEWGERPE